MSNSLALYRRFVRLGCQAVEFKQPQTKVLKAILRRRFAEDNRRPDELHIQNTLQFFRAAANSAGLERRCLTTMIHCAASHHRRALTYAQSPSLRRNDGPLIEANTKFYSTIVQGLNESMGLCL